MSGSAAAITNMARLLLHGVGSLLPRLSASHHLYTVTLLPHTLHRHFTYAATLLAERKYTEKHEWVAVEDNIGTIGITNYAQESLGDIVYAQLPEVDAEYEQMEECGALESVKAASELYSPVSGKVTAVNTAVEDQPSLINQSCYDEGWLFKLELTVPAEIDELMDEDAYKKFLKESEQ
ncbi:glycine cleavage system H protein [Cherax quadricarinatus]